MFNILVWNNARAPTLFALLRCPYPNLTRPQYSITSWQYLDYNWKTQSSPFTYTQLNSTFRTALLASPRAPSEKYFGLSNRTNVSKARSLRSRIRWGLVRKLDCGRPPCLCIGLLSSLFRFLLYRGGFRIPQVLRISFTPSCTSPSVQMVFSVGEQRNQASGKFTYLTYYPRPIWTPVSEFSMIGNSCRPPGYLHVWRDSANPPGIFDSRIDTVVFSITFSSGTGIFRSFPLPCSYQTDPPSNWIRHGDASATLFSSCIVVILTHSFIVHFPSRTILEPHEYWNHSALKSQYG